LRQLAVGLPGIYDLLPVYRCVDETDTVRRLEPGDIARFGGSAELARAAFELPRPGPLPGHRALIGVDQPTASSLTLADGLVTAHPHTFRLTLTVSSIGTPTASWLGSSVAATGPSRATQPYPSR